MVATSAVHTLHFYRLGPVGNIPGGGGASKRMKFWGPKIFWEITISYGDTTFFFSIIQ